MCLAVAEQSSVHIDAPVERVFGVFRNPANWQELTSGILYEDVELTEDGLGTSYRWVATLAGIRISGAGEFIEFIPDERIVDRSSRSFEGTWTYTFEPEGTGMKLTIESRPRSLWRVPPFRWLLAWSAARGHAAVLSELKARLEA